MCYYCMTSHVKRLLLMFAIGWKPSRYVVDFYESLFVEGEPTNWQDRPPGWVVVHGTPIYLIKTSQYTQNYKAVRENSRLLIN